MPTRASAPSSAAASPAKKPRSAVLPKQPSKAPVSKNAPKSSARAVMEDVNMDHEAASQSNGHVNGNGAEATGPVKGRAAGLTQEANGGSRAGKGHVRRGSLRAPPVKIPIPSPPPISEPPRELFVFGCGDMGQFGLGPDALEDIPRPRMQTWFQEHANDLSRAGRSGAGGLETVTAGGMHTLAVDENGRVYTWGINDNACLGRVTVGVPDPKDPGKTIHNENLEAWPFVIEQLEKEGFRTVSVAAGDSVSVAVSDTGDFRAWGSFRSDDGILGFDGVPGHSRFQFTPIAIQAFQRNKLQIIQAACGSNHVLALTSQGHVYVWGEGGQNQLGRRIMERRKLNGLEPERLALRNIVHVAAGQYHSFALDSNGIVWAWGLNTFHQTGLTPARGGDESMVMIPAQVDALLPENHGGSRVIQISGGEHHSLFLFDNGEVWACGRSDTCQTGLGPDHPGTKAIEERRKEEKTEFVEAVKVAREKLEELTTKGDDEEARRAAETTLQIAEARLRSPSNDYVPEPVRVCFPPIPEEYSVVPPFPSYADSKPSDNPIAQISAGTRHNLAVSKSGHLYSWGLGETCQLGLGKEEQAAVPTLVRSAQLKQYHAVQASAGGQHCCVLAIKGKDEEGRPLKR
ncbi:hypothetical protein BD324DRAFT_599054 [Kockovaella imperatae]|uniref:RCC1-like domain-containing protein n=1 Tax=Kockovaella imperatae TaxID=4999 RepID=A0A1Y1UJX8_9TREE|nr:hypothetical protein BD324DRAFT_599054 [Kockovaella imperatae]ORX38289.1 hypothetical protein BD324DRAFT_599054 [Kockovaella imperatae]